MESIGWARQGYRFLRTGLFSGTSHSVDIVLTVLAQYGVAGLGLASTLVAVRTLQPAEYGIASMIVAYPSLVWSIVSVKSVSVSTRYIAGFRRDGANGALAALCKLTFLLDFGLGFVAFAAVFLTGARVMPELAHIQGGLHLLTLYAASFPLYSLTGTGSALLVVAQQFRSLALLQFLGALVSFVILVPLLDRGFGIAGLIVPAAFSQSFVGVSMLILATRVMSEWGLGQWWRASMAEVTAVRRAMFAAFGWNFLLVTLSGVKEQLPAILLGRLRGPAEAGFYVLATRLVNVANYLAVSLRRIAFPTLAAVRHSDRGEIRRIVQRWSRGAGLPAASLLIAASGVLPFILPPILGPAYVEVVGGARVMLVGVVAGTVFFWVTSIFFILDRVHVLTLTYASYVLLLTLVGLPIIVASGFSGYAILVAVGESLFLFCLLALSLRMLKSEVQREEQPPR